MTRESLAVSRLIFRKLPFRLILPVLVRLRATLIGMANYRVHVSDGPHTGVKLFPSLEAAIAYRDWLKANNVAEFTIRIVCTEL